ncbi:hypothetical protein METHB2_60032 [Candidatus Methylobacter favarea]|uniref:Uncharacterized protein n=1 Tax=Candidatus Methylobacter favarea TaxID=2707345 RepID=A0A8S0WKQ4_9GAMM|nr:hypothetical protein METHB2_60032 [Candidatus Methylobacter favarea]
MILAGGHPCKPGLGADAKNSHEQKQQRGGLEKLYPACLQGLCGEAGNGSPLHGQDGGQ